MKIHFDGVNWCAIDTAGVIHKSDKRLSVIEAFLDKWDNCR